MTDLRERAIKYWSGSTQKKNWHIVDTLCEFAEQENNRLENQLEQAKSLINQLINSSPYKTSSAEYFYKDLIKEAKQFLKEENK